MAKYEELIDDFELEKRIRTIPEDMDLTEYIKQRGGVDYPEEEKADGGSVGIEILFEKKKDGGRVGYRVGGASGREYGQKYDPGKKATDTPMSTSFQSDGGGSNNKIMGPIEKVILKKIEDKIPKDDNPFKFLQGYSKTLPAQNRFFPMFRTLKEPTPYTSRNLLDKALTELNLSYPKLEFQDQYGYYNTENIKTAVDNAVLKGDLSPIEGLNITQSITTQGDPSAVGITYTDDFINFATPDISEGDYTGGINLNLADKAKLTGTFDVTDDKLSKRDLGINIGDGTLKLDQTTYPGMDYQKNVVDLNKDLNLANNLDLNLRGNIENLRSDGSTFRTDQSLTPTLTYTGGVGDGTFKLSGSKEIVEGGSLPNVSFTGSFPIDQKTYIDADGPQTIDKGVISLRGSDLLSGDRSAVLGYDKTIGEIGDNFYLDVGGQIDLTNPQNYAGMLKLKKTFKDGGRVGLFMGGPPLTGQALAIYNSMNVSGATDQEIADRLQSLGLYTPGKTTTTPGEGIIGAQINQGGGGGGANPFGPLDLTYTRAAGSKPKISEDAFFGLGRFFQGKERGTLGDRQQRQFELGQKLPSILSAIAGMQSPFNPNSRNYNPLMAEQLNFLEAGTGTRVTGTSDNLKLTEGLNLIGRDPNTGGLKYGAGSVLFGKNVISGFGTNDYEQALKDYITKMNVSQKRKETAFKAQKIAQAERELKALQEKQAQNLQTRIDAERAAGRIANQQMQRQEGGRGGGNLSRSLGISKQAAAEISEANRKAGMGGYGLKDGGLATMFRNKR